MKFATILVAGLGLVAAGTATAGTRITDVDYLRASRCKAIAESLGGTDTAAVDALLKDARKSRASFIVERAQAEAQRARLEARGDRKDKLSAELAGPCTAYMGHGKDVAAR